MAAKKKQIEDIDDILPVDGDTDINGHCLITVKEKTHLLLIAHEHGLTLEAIVNLNPHIRGLEARKGEKVRIS